MDDQPAIAPSVAARFRDVLETRLGELSRRVERIENEARQPVDDDLEEQAIDREGDEPAEQLERAALAEMAAVEEALRRIVNGTYGRCTSCGGPIGLQRLEFVPAAAQCIACARGVADR